MEIISYVGFENTGRSAADVIKSKFSSLFRLHSRKTGKDGSYVYAFHPSGVLPQKEQSVRHGAFQHAFSLLKTVPAFGRIVSISCLSALCSVCMFWMIRSVVSYAENHTGPLQLKDSGRIELDTLDKVMSSFAMTGNADYNDNGDILDGNGKSAGISAGLFKKPVVFSSYKVRPGDTISGITRKFGLTNLSTVIAVNDIDNARALYTGQKLRIPSMDGLICTVKQGNSLAGLSARYNVPLEDLLDVNDLDSQTIHAGQQLFIPGAKMDSSKLHEALGDMFKIPLAVSYRISSRFGWRSDPFTGVRSYHTGIDMACPQGTPIYAAMGGKVLTAGWSNVFGNYVIINHPNGYQTLYGHMSKILARKGQPVAQGTRIGLVGTTGYSTGPHLHFTVYKAGQLVDPFTVLR